MSSTFSKLRVSEEELKKQLSVGAAAPLDILILKKHLEGLSYDQLSREYNISRGQIQIRLNDVMQKLPERLKISIPDKKVIKECLNYKTFWLQLIENYELGIRLYNGNGIFNIFMSYFKIQDTKRKVYIIQQLQEHL